MLGCSCEHRAIYWIQRIRPCPGKGYHPKQRPLRLLTIYVPNDQPQGFAAAFPGQVHIGSIRWVQLTTLTKYLTSPYKVLAVIKFNYSNWAWRKFYQTIGLL